MTPVSVFAATFVKGAKNYEGDDWVYPGCVTYTMEHMERLAKQHGLACRPVGWRHPNNQTWVVITDPSNMRAVRQRLEAPQ